MGEAGAGDGNRARPDLERRALTKAKQRAFLDTLASTCNVTQAAAAAGLSIGRCYRMRERNAAFGAAWNQTIAARYQRLEEALLDYVLTRISEAPGAALTTADLGCAVGLLQRHHAANGGKQPVEPEASAAETDAALRKKLDQFARRIAVQ